MEVMRRLRENDLRPERTIHLTYMPGKAHTLFLLNTKFISKQKENFNLKDEELSGIDGMMKFVKTKHFTDLNVGLVLDEGLASATDEYCIYYSERLRWSQRIFFESLRIFQF